MKQLIIAIISSVIATVIFAVCLRLQKSIYLLLTLLISPIIALVIISPEWTVINWHGFMHASMVLNIMNGLVPPEDILLAGYPLRYPWAHHYLTAWLCQIMHISPAMGIALINILALIVSAVVIFKTAQLLHPTQQTGIFAVFLSIFGTSTLFLEPLKQLDSRALPLHKFAHGNSNPLGFCFFFVGLFFLVRLFASRGKPFINGTGIGLSVAATAFLYPICWLAIVVSSIFVCLGQAIVTRGRKWQPILIVCLALFFGSAVAIPYLHSISAGRAATAEMSLNFRLLGRFKSLLFISILPVLILWVKRHQLKVLINNQSSEVLTLFCGGVGLTLLYIFVSIPLDCAYKFLMLLMAAIGIFTAPFFESLYQKKPVIAKSVIALLVLPTAFMFTTMFNQKQFVDPVYTEGMDIRHSDARMDKLYSWIATKTPVDAVVVDSFLSVPTLSHRSLYVGTDLRRDRDPNFAKFDGWTMEAKTMSTQVFGQDPEVVKRRLQNAISLLTPSNQDRVDMAAASVKQEFARRQVLAIVRDPAIKMAFDANPRFTKSFEESSVWVYTIDR